ncbi:MAG: tRNA pseudouridine(55) synthase TruB [Thermodesulfobacteriota bacterium]
MDGIIVLDKPEGITSAKAVAEVKKLTPKGKIGHTGTLDPFATGILVLCLGKATRLARFFLHGRKAYEAEMLLGVETDTQDLTGTVTSRAQEVCVSDEEIIAALARFRGKIWQKPPVFSALKHQGVPLYKLARRGDPVEKEPRQVEVFELGFLGREGDRVRFFARVSGGTYIRSLCADIGRALSCGAHLTALRRTENNGFSAEEATGLAEIKELGRSGRLEEKLLPMAESLRSMDHVSADRNLADKIRNGRLITWQDLGGRPGGRGEETVKVLDAEGGLLAVLTGKPDGVGLTYCCVFA